MHMAGQAVTSRSHVGTERQTQLLQAWNFTRISCSRSATLHCHALLILDFWPRSHAHLLFVLNSLAFVTHSCCYVTLLRLCHRQNLTVFFCDCRKAKSWLSNANSRNESCPAGIDRQTPPLTTHLFQMCHLLLFFFTAVLLCWCSNQPLSNTQVEKR